MPSATDESLIKESLAALQDSAGNTISRSLAQFGMPPPYWLKLGTSPLYDLSVAEVLQIQVLSDESLLHKRD